jgi:hypothetical protein
MDDIPTLNIADLQSAIDILNIAIKRGAFEPDEILAVGTTYSALKKFVDHTISTNKITNKD